MRWSLKTATDLTRAGKSITNYAGYDEGKKSKKPWALPVKKGEVKFEALEVYTFLFCRKCTRQTLHTGNTRQQATYYYCPSLKPYTNRQMDSMLLGTG